MNDVASGWKFEPYRGRMRIAAVAAALVALFAPVVRLVEQVSKCGPGEPFTRPTTCTRVATEPGREGLALQYWLYYPFNDVNNKHESDWEMIQLDFAASDAASALEQDPTYLGYGHHEGVEVAEWSSVKLERLPAEVTLS